MPLQHKARARRHDAEIAVRPPVYHFGGKDILARLQVWGDVERFVTPIFEVGALRADGSQLTVYIQLIAVVGRHVNDKTVRLSRQRERAAVHRYRVVGLRGILTHNPTGIPLLRGILSFGVVQLRQQLRLNIQTQKEQTDG